MVMSGVSSASPDNLEFFVKHAGAATDRLESAIASAAGTIEAFYDAPADPRFRPPGGDAAFQQVRQLMVDDLEDQRWLGGVRRAFIEADTNTLPNATIARSLTAQGINPNPPGQLTADEPVYRGATMYSGWTDDPVCTGSGNFFEPEVDLAVPDALSILAWPRSYNSRSASAGAHGPGWCTWADVRLEVSGDAAVVFGPDGQEAPFARSAAGEWVAHPDLHGRLEEGDGGFSLAWAWMSRHPGATWKFGAGGRLAAVVDRFSGLTSVERDGTGRLAALVHAGGRRLALTWRGERLAGLASSDGRQVEFDYDHGRLVEVRRPAGRRRYTYGDDGRLAEVFDADGVRLVANTYDEEGRVATQTSPQGRVIHFRYRPSALVVTDEQEGPATLFRHDPLGRLVELQLADGSIATRTFDAAGHPVEVVDFDGQTTRRTFDRRGRCVAEEGPGGCRRFEHDDLDRVTVAVDEAGVELRFDYDGPGPLPSVVRGPLELRTRFAVDGGRVRAVTDADGVETRFDYDAEGQVVAVIDGEGGVTRFGHHRSGSLQTLERPTGEVTRWRYDDHDRPVQVELADGAVFTRSYSDAGRLLEERGPAGWSARYSWGADGELAQTTDAAGLTTAYVRDVNGHLSGVEQVGGGRWSFGWDPLGRLRSWRGPGGEDWELAWSAQGLASVTGPAGHTRTYDLEVGESSATLEVAGPAGRRVRLRFGVAGRLEGGETPEGPSRLDIAYDAAGRPARWSVDRAVVAEAGYTPAGRLRRLTRTGVGSLVLEYDRAGRVVGWSGPDGQITVGYDLAGRPVGLSSAGAVRVEIAWDPAGRPVRLDAGGRVRRFDYDPLGRPAAVSGPDGCRWEWDHDPVGRLVAARGPDGSQTAVSRDRLGRVVEVVGPEGGRWSYRYDEASRLAFQSDPLQRRMAYHWDRAGRISRVDLPDGRARRYRWNPDGTLRATEADGPGGADRVRLEVTREPRSQSLTWRDGDGRMVQVTRDGLGRVVRSQLGRGDQRADWRVDWADPAEPVVSRPGGPAVRARLSGGGLPVRLDHPALGSVVLERDAEGRLLSVNAAGLTRRWDRNGHGDAVAYREETRGGVRQARLQRDGAGRVVAVTEDGVTHTFAYDEAGRLVAATGPVGVQAWDYDRAGRLVIERGPGGERRFAYDEADQLQSVDGPAGRTSYVYDALGRRVSVSGPGKKLHYTWDGADRLVAIERIGPEGSVRVKLAYDPLGRLVEAGDQELEWGPPDGPLGLVPTRIGDRELVALPGVPLAEIAAGRPRWLSADWRGSVGARSAWGAGPGGGDGGPAVGFLGEIEVEGLVWLRHRWYDPDTHTFLSRDPLGAPLASPTATNAYLYANNDPLQWMDPLGLKPLTAAAASQQMQSWRQGHWEEIAVDAVSLAAVGVMLAVAPEASALILPMVLGAAGGAGGTVVNSLLTGRPVDWGEVVMDGTMGAALGVVGAGFGGLTESLGTVGSRLAAVAYGGVSGFAFTYLDRWATHAPFNLVDEAIGTGFGMLGALAPHVRDDYSWSDETTLTEAQKARVVAGERDARFYRPEVTRAQAAADAANRAARSVNSLRDGLLGGTTAGVGGAVTPPDPDPRVPPSSTYYPPVSTPVMPALP
jgi:RHS repeat-associated protein